jgi:hypothetical protein
MSLFLVLMMIVLNICPPTDVLVLRKLYQQAVTDKADAQKLISYIESCQKENLATGYKGSAMMLLAKHSVNPYEKLKYFNSGKNLLEESIKNEPNNPEIIFLRLAVQTNLPSFLNYSNNINTDANFLVQFVSSDNSSNDETLKKNIIKFLVQCKALSQAEKKRLMLLL